MPTTNKRAYRRTIGGNNGRLLLLLLRSTGAKVGDYRRIIHSIQFFLKRRNCYCCLNCMKGDLWNKLRDQISMSGLYTSSSTWYDTIKDKRRGTIIIRRAKVTGNTTTRKIFRRHCCQESTVRTCFLCKVLYHRFWSSSELAPVRRVYRSNCGHS